MILVFKLLHRHFAGRKVATRDTVPFAYQGSSSDPTSDGTFTYGRTPSGGLVSISDGSDGLLAGLDRHWDLTHLHTPEGTVTDTSLYDPYGVPLHVTGGFSPQVGFQADWTDPDSGEVWMGARWYDTSTATFLSRDSVMGELATPISLNRCLYRWANPLTYWDPNGKTAYPTARGDGHVEDWTRSSDGTFTRNHQRVAPDRNHLAAPQGSTLPVEAKGGGVPCNLPGAEPRQGCRPLTQYPIRLPQLAHDNRRGGGSGKKGS